MRTFCFFEFYDIENAAIGCFCAPSLVQKDANIVHTDAKLLPKDAKVVQNSSFMLYFYPPFCCALYQIIEKKQA